MKANHYISTWCKAKKQNSVLSCMLVVGVTEAHRFINWSFESDLNYETYKPFIQIVCNLFNGGGLTWVRWLTEPSTLGKIKCLGH